MKLNWLRAGCASIAESGEYTAMARMVRNKAWIIDLRDSGGVDHSNPPCSYATREAAEAACETWLDDHDKPVWHDVTEWLSWVEWRGHHVIVHPDSAKKIWDSWFWNDVTGREDCGNNTTRDEAKAAAEKYVRNQTGGAE